MTTFSDDLSAYAEQLMEDLDSERPRVYAPVVWAYQDDRVRDAISARLEAGEILVSAVQIAPDRALRRERVYFDFAMKERLDAKRPGVLVQISDDNAVAEIVDPIDLDENEGAPIAVSADDTLPLFVARANEPSNMTVNIAARTALAERWAGFAQQPALARALIGGVGGGLGFDFNDSICGGTPTSSDVISSTGSKEDPDQDTRGGRFDDCQMFF